MKVITLVLFIVLILMIMFGCQGKTLEPKPKSYASHGAINSRYYELYVIDGCEYLGDNSGPSAVLTHKGNCNNPIHVYTVEFKLK